MRLNFICFFVFVLFCFPVESVLHKQVCQKLVIINLVVVIDDANSTVVNYRLAVLFLK